MIAKANGQLAHHFHMPYWASMALQFENEMLAKAVLKVLSGKWKISEVKSSALIWHGNADELTEVENLLEKFGGNKKKISSINKSIDYGEPFKVSIPVSIENPNQLSLLKE